MEKLDLNVLLGREKDVAFIKESLKNFELNRNNLTVKKGIYIYGNPGSGKTDFVVSILKEMDYDVIKYDAGDIRNKSIIDTITKHNMSDKNIMSLFHKKIKRIVIVMDEIDGMNNGDKGGINSLIKLIRPKKTKKQKQEEITMNPIICIGNYHIDKKIKELMKVCNTLELKSPTTEQMTTIVKEIMPGETCCEDIVQYVQGDLRKVKNIYSIYKNNKNILKKEMIQNIFRKKSYNDDTKKITMKLINQPFSIEEHNTIMNETDRTIVGLLWHENIIDVLNNVPMNKAIPFYLSLLNNMCFADYIDRITFQKQIWQFNEMSSLIKTFKNNKIYHDSFTFKKKPKINHEDIRFTKVLTKYSTEYNNSTFIQNLCQQLSMDKKDIFSFFLDLKEKYEDNQMLALFESYEINKLDINRIFRYLEKYTRENCDFADDETIIDTYEEPEIIGEE
jgi:DNA polymerase III delta prime subunit